MEEKLSLKEITENCTVKLENQNKELCLRGLKEAYNKHNNIHLQAHKMGTWKKDYLDGNPNNVYYILKKEIEELKEFFNDNGVLDYYELKKEYKTRHYYYEIVLLFFGLFMLVNGIQNEMKKISSVGYNYKFQTVVMTGAYQALLGLLVIICCISSIRQKIKNK